MRLLVIGLLAVAWCIPAMAAKTHEYMLDNGLKLVVREDHRAPVVVTQIWYKVGGSYESTGSTGVSHLLEHLMFQGTKKHPAGTFSRLIAAHGGSENAATSSDYTFYYETLPVSALSLALELEADRMQHVSLHQAEFDKEIKVVREERRLRTDDNPQMTTYERFKAAAFISSPYHHPVVGWMDDLLHMQLQHAQQWYQHWYVPNNATVVVVGDVNPDEVLTLVQQHFAAIPSRATPLVAATAELPGLGSKALNINIPAKLPWLVMGYHVPSVNTASKDWQPYALEVATAILSANNSARLPSELIHGTQIATQASAHYDLYSRLDGLFTLFAEPSQGHNVQQLRRALAKELQWLQQDKVSAAELQRAKTQLIASDTYAKDSMAYQAQQIGSLESVGLSWRVADEYATKIAAVTAEQIQQVAKQYFIASQLTVATLQPLQQTTQGE